MHSYLFLTVWFPPKFMINVMTFDKVKFAFLDGDIPLRPSYGFYTSSQLLDLLEYVVM